MTLVQLIVGDDQIDPKRAIPREEHLRNTRYFVGGLSPATTADSMKAFFAAYGKVVDATVMVDRESGRSKGFGFVTFEDAQDTDQLVGRADLVMDEKQASVPFIRGLLCPRLLMVPHRLKSRLHNPGAKETRTVARMQVVGNRFSMTVTPEHPL